MAGAAAAMAALVQRDGAGGAAATYFSALAAVQRFLSAVGLGQHAAACCDAFVAAQWPSSQWVTELEKMVVDSALNSFVASLQKHPAVDSVQLAGTGEIEACFASTGPLGITFAAQSAKDAPVHVSAIKPTGLAAKPAFSSLCSGLQLTSVQGMRCSNMHYREIIDLLKRAARPMRLSFFGEGIAGKGVLRIVFRRADPLGIQFGSPPPLSPRRNPIIKTIRPDGLAALPENSALVPGLVLESVQGLSVTDRAFKDIVAQIRTTPRPLELVFSGSVPCVASRQTPAAQGAHVMPTLDQPGSLGRQFKPDRTPSPTDAVHEATLITPPHGTNQHIRLVHQPQVHQTVEKTPFELQKQEEADLAGELSVNDPTAHRSREEVLQLSRTEEREVEVSRPTVTAMLVTNAASADHGSQGASKYRVVKLAAIRDGLAPDAARVGRVNVGDLVTVFELQEGGEGLTKARTEKGWVATATFSGIRVLEPVGQAVPEVVAENGILAQQVAVDVVFHDAQTRKTHPEPEPEPEPSIDFDIDIVSSTNDDDELSRLQSELELLNFSAEDESPAQHTAERVRLRQVEAELAAARDLLKTNYDAAKQAQADSVRNAAAELAEAKRQLMETEELHRCEIEEFKSQPSRTPSPVKRVAEFQSQVHARALATMSSPSPTSSIASSAGSHHNQFLQRQLQATAQKLVEAEQHCIDAERRAALSSQALATLPGVLATHMHGHLGSGLSIELVERIVADVLPSDDPLQRTFTRFDRNGDGTLDAAEQKSMLEAMGHTGDIDSVVDKSLDFEGFRSLLVQLHISSSSSRASSPISISAPVQQRPSRDTGGSAGATTSMYTPDTDDSDVSTTSSVRAKLWKRNREKVHERRRRESDSSDCPAVVSNVPVAELSPEVRRAAEEISPPGRQYGRGTSTSMTTSPYTPTAGLSPASRRQARVPGGHHVSSPKRPAADSIGQVHAQYDVTNETGYTPPPQKQALTPSPRRNRLALCNTSSQESEGSPISPADANSSLRHTAQLHGQHGTRAPPLLSSSSTQDRDITRHESEVATITVSTAGSHMGYQHDSVNDLNSDLLRIFATTASFGGTSRQGGDTAVLRARAVLALPELADRPLTNSSMLRGQIAVVRRGGATFVHKARRMQEAGAIGLIVINSSDVPCLVESHDGDRVDDIHISVVCVRLSDGESLLQTLGFKNCLVSLVTSSRANAMQISEGTPPN
eukprot:COSAG02_NODE_758_length_17516_cov_53.301085_13_plen_1216_part_00